MQCTSTGTNSQVDTDTNRKASYTNFRGMWIQAKYREEIELNVWRKHIGEHILILIEYPGKYLPNAKIEVLAPGYYRICLLFKCQSLTKRPVLDLVANHG